jgi:hypothetical protein
MSRECASNDQEAVAARAARLFLDGYSAERLDRETVVVRTPDGHRYLVNALFGTCTCQATVEAQEQPPCEHLLGYASLLCEQQMFEEAQVAALEERYDAWGLTLENDRTERLLREMGVCEF